MAVQFTRKMILLIKNCYSFYEVPVFDHVNHKICCVSCS